MSSSRRPPAPPESRRARRTSQRAARREARDRDLARRRAGAARGISSTVWLTGAAVVVALLIVGFLVLSNQHAPVADVTAPSPTSPPALADGKTLGSSGAPVTVDLWADFQCPYCGQFTFSEEPQLVTSFIATGKAKLVFHDYAFLGPESITAAVAATCAEQQGKFWPYHDYLYVNQAGENEGAFSQARLLQIATAVGLDQAAFSTCASDPAVLAQVQAEQQQGAAAGVVGTPTIFVNGTKLIGYDLASVTSAIQAALGNATPGPLPSSAPSSPAVSPTG